MLAIGCVRNRGQKTWTVSRFVSCFDAISSRALRVKLRILGRGEVSICIF